MSYISNELIDRVDLLFLREKVLLKVSKITGQWKLPDILSVWKFLTLGYGLLCITIITVISKIHLVVYYQYCVLIG